MCWSSVHRRKYAQAHPHLPNTEITKLLSAAWHKMSDGEKQRFYDESNLLQQAHKAAYPNYSYAKWGKADEKRERRERRKLKRLGIAPTVGECGLRLDYT